MSVKEVSQTVGEAAYNILTKDNNPTILAGDIAEARSDDYIKSMEEAIASGFKMYKSPFYVLVLSHKEMWAVNVMRNWFIPRQTPVHATYMYQHYPNHMKTLYMIRKEDGEPKVCWSLPGHQDMISVAKHPNNYDPQLVKWIYDFTLGNLDQDSYLTAGR